MLNSQDTSLSSRLQLGIQALFHALLLVTPFLFTSLNEELFEFNKMVFVYAATAVVVSLWAARCIVERRFIFRATPLYFPLLLFFSSQLLSTVFSLHTHTSLFGYYTRFHGGLLSTLSYIALYFVFTSTVNRKQLRQFFVTAFLAGALASLYAIPEKLGISFSCWFIREELSTACWSESTNPRYRIFGTFGQPNWLAAYAAILIPLGFSLAVAQKTRGKERALYAASTLLLFVALLLTNSRSGFLATAVGGSLVAAGLVWELRNRSTPKLRTAIGKRAVALAGSLLLVLAVLGSSFTPKFQDLFQESTQAPVPQPANRLEVGGTDSGEIRKIVWTGAFRVWQRYPIFGSGVETFAYSYYKDRPQEHNLVSEWDFLYNKAHNEFLNFLATTGAVGLLTYVFLLGSFCVLALRAFFGKAPAEERLISLGLVGGVTALSVSNFFGFSTVMVSLLMFWYFAVLAVLIKEKEDEEHAAARTTTLLSTAQLVLLAATALLGMYFVQKNITYWRADAALALGKQQMAGGLYAEGLENMALAIRRSPQEDLFHNDISEQYAVAALELARSGNATGAARLSNAALRESDIALRLNPHHLNYYKSRLQVLIRLSQLDESLLPAARETLLAARELSPTDPRLSYNLSLVESSLGNDAESLRLLEETLALKPNYAAPLIKLSQVYIAQDRPHDAIPHLEYFLRSVSPGDPVAEELLRAAEASVSADVSE